MERLARPLERTSTAYPSPPPSSALVGLLRSCLFHPASNSVCPGFRRPDSPYPLLGTHVESPISNAFPSRTTIAIFAGHRISERDPAALRLIGSDSTNPGISVDVGKYSELCFQLRTLASITSPGGAPTKSLFPSLVCSDVYPGISAANRKYDKLIPHSCQQCEWPLYEFGLDRRTRADG